MLKLFGKEVTPISVSDRLFVTDNIKSINIQAFKYDCNGEVIFEGNVSFKQGNLSGTRKFKGTSIPDIYNQMIDFCSNL